MHFTAIFNNFTTPNKRKFSKSGGLRAAHIYSDHALMGEKNDLELTDRQTSIAGCIELLAWFQLKLIYKALEKPAQDEKTVKHANYRFITDTPKPTYIIY